MTCMCMTKVRNMIVAQSALLCILLRLERNLTLESESVNCQFKAVL